MARKNVGLSFPSRRLSTLVVAGLLITWSLSVFALAGRPSGGMTDDLKHGLSGVFILVGGLLSLVVVVSGKPDPSARSVERSQRSQMPRQWRVRWYSLSITTLLMTLVNFVFVHMNTKLPWAVLTVGINATSLIPLMLLIGQLQALIYLQRGYFGEGSCQSCGYDMAHVIRDVCPECGTQRVTDETD